MIHLFPRLDYIIHSERDPEDLCSIVKSVTAPGRGGVPFSSVSGASSSLTEEERFFLLAAVVFFGLFQFAFYSPAKQAAQRLKELFT